MLTLVSATPGSGKTLKVVEMIFDLLQKDYVVYTNILEISIPGVLKMPSNADWRLLDSHKKDQHGNPTSLANKPIAVIYDEAHEHPAFASDEDVLYESLNFDHKFYDNQILEIEAAASSTLEKRTLIREVERRRKADFEKQVNEILDIGRSLTLHRHFGFDIFMITQYPKYLKPVVLGCVGRHLYLRRIFGLKRAWVYEFPEAHAHVTRSVRADALVRTNWSFPEHLFKYYKSSEIHTHTTNIPSKYILIPVLAVLFLFTMIYFAAGNSFFKPIFSGKDESSLEVNNQDIQPLPVEEQPKQEINLPASAEKSVLGSSLIFNQSTSSASAASDSSFLDQPLLSPQTNQNTSNSIVYGCITVGSKKTCYDSIPN